MATPFLVIFMLFNGSIVTRVTAPVFLRWVFEVSLAAGHRDDLVLYGVWREGLRGHHLRKAAGAVTQIGPLKLRIFEL